MAVRNNRGAALGVAAVAAESMQLLPSNGEETGLAPWMDKERTERENLVLGQGGLWGPSLQYCL